jgi:serine protease Do
MKVLRIFGVLALATAAGLAVTVYGQELRQGGERRGRELSMLAGRGAELGVSIHDVDANAPERDKGASGVVVDDVRPDSAAEKAGLKRSDVIVEFDGEHVRSARQFSRLVQETAPGRTVKATIVRDGKRMDLQVTPSEGRSARVTIDGDRLEDRIRERLGDLDVDRFVERMPPMDFNFDFDLPNMSRGRLGVTVDELTPQLGEYFGVKDGVLVAAVADDSPAARAGLKAGDVITSVDGHAVRSRGDLSRELANAGEKEASIGFVRDKKSSTATVHIESRRRGRSSRPA